MIDLGTEQLNGKMYITLHVYIVVAIDFYLTGAHDNKTKHADECM